MAPRTRMLWIAMVAVLAGCGSGGLSPRDDDGDRLQSQARDALARYDRAVLDAGALPAAPRRTGDVVWEGGKSRPFPLISADEALNQVAAAAEDCGECVPLEVTGARLTTVRIQTTRGPATAPAWEFKLKGTAVRVTRVAVASSSTVTVTRRHAAEEDCDALGARRTAAVELAQPLAERAVLEVQQGLPVALTITE